MKLSKTYFLVLFIISLLTTQLYSQDKINPNFLKVLKYINEYNFPVNTSSFEGVFKEVFYSDSTYTYNMNLNDNSLYYLYDYDTSINFVEGRWMRGKNITFDNLTFIGERIAIGYTKCDNCIMIYYIGIPTLAEMEDIGINVEYLNFNGEKIQLSHENKSFNPVILTAYEMEWQWQGISSIVKSRYLIESKTESFIYSDKLHETINSKWHIDLESGIINSEFLKE